MDIHGWVFSGCSRSMGYPTCVAWDRTIPFRSCLAVHFCCNFNAEISKPPKCSPGHSFCGLNWIPNARSALLQPRETFLDRGDRVETDHIRTSGPIEDDESTGPREPIVVRGDFLEEREDFEGNEIRPTFDALPRQPGGNPQKNCQVRTEHPRFARPLQESYRIVHETFESRPLIRLRRIRVLIAQDQFPRLKMGLDFLQMLRSIGEEEKGFCDGADLVLKCVAHCLAEPRPRGLACQIHGVSLRLEGFRDEATHGRLPRAVDALESHEPGEHVRRQRTRGTLNRRCPVRIEVPHNVFIESGGSVARRPTPRGAGTISWKIHPDMRRLSDGGGREARCRKCHVRIVVLPDDRRQGYCFDCYDSLEIHSKIAV